MTLLYNRIHLKTRRKELRHHQTEAERTVWNMVRNRQILNLKFFRQYSVGSYILDFYCPETRLAIEIDGGQHNEPENLLHDEERTKFLNEQNIKVIRFWNTEVLQNKVGVCQVIYDTLNKIKLS